METHGFNPELAPGKDAGLFGENLNFQTDPVIIVGVPWEPTVSYGRGSSRTPERLVPASHQLDLFDLFLGRNFGGEVGMLPLRADWLALNRHCIELAGPILEAGGRVQDGELTEALAEINRASAQLNAELQALAGELIDCGKTVGILGGDHSAPLGSIKAHAERFPGMGILHIDAHHDLRQAYEGFQYSHASIMFNALGEAPGIAKLVSVAIRDFSEEEYLRAMNDPRVTTYYDRDLKARQARGAAWDSLHNEIIAQLPGLVYVSFDIDGLDPNLCPHTGTPVAGGLDFYQAVFLLEAVVESGRRIIGFDLCEIAPSKDPGDEWDLNVGARMLHKLCALAHRGRP